MSALRAGVLALALLAVPASAGAQLLPPPPMAPAPYPAPPGAPPGGPGSATVAQLNEAESEDSGRRLELFYANAEVGGGFLAGKGGSGLFGPGLSLGVRLLTFTLGARGRFLVGPASPLLQVNGEAAYHLVFGSTDLVLGAHGGLSAFTASGGGSGGNVGLDLGFDHYLSSLFSVGAGAAPDMLFVGSDPRFGLYAGARLGLHLGL